MKSRQWCKNNLQQRLQPREKRWLR